MVELPSCHKKYVLCHCYGVLSEAVSLTLSKENRRTLVARRRSTSGTTHRDNAAIIACAAFSGASAVTPIPDTTRVILWSTSLGVLQVVPSAVVR